MSSFHSCRRVGRGCGLFLVLTGLAPALLSGNGCGAKYEPPVYTPPRSATNRVLRFDETAPRDNFHDLAVKQFAEPLAARERFAVAGSVIENQDARAGRARVRAVVYRTSRRGERVTFANGSGFLAASETGARTYQFELNAPTEPGDYSISLELGGRFVGRGELTVRDPVP